MIESPFFRVLGAAFAFIVAAAALGQAIEWIWGRSNFARSAALFLSSRYPKGALVAVALLGAAMGAALFVTVWRFVVSEHAALPSSNVLVFVDYQVDRAFPIELKPGEQLWHMRVLERELPDYSVTYVESGPRKLSRRLSPDGSVQRTPFITVSNRGKDTLRDIEVTFPVLFYKPGSAPSYNGPPVEPSVSLPHVVKIPILGPDERFEFAVTPWSTTYIAVVQLPTTARVLVPGEMMARTVQVRRSQLTDYERLKDLRFQPVQ